MRYVHVYSLCPYVLKYKLFPLGHPERITEDFQDVRSYFGMIQCRVLPPQRIVSPSTPLPDRRKVTISFVPHLCGRAPHGPPLPMLSQRYSTPFHGTLGQLRIKQSFRLRVQTG